MAGAGAADIEKHVKIYLMIFGWLAILTVVTVWVSYLEVSVPVAVLIALFIASIKASLVACYFMHLTTERATLYWILILCILFFLCLMLLPTWMTTETDALNNAVS